MVRIRKASLMVGLLLVAAGCPVGPEAADAGPDDADAGPSGGLTFVFEPQPSLPASLGGAFDCRVSELAIQLENIRAVGDSSTVERPGLSLEWGEAGAEPASVSFGEARHGRYSRLEALVAAYSLAGTVVVSGDTWPFEIEDQPPSPVAITVALTDVTVEVGAERQVQILVELAPIVESVLWHLVEADGEELRLGPEDAQILGVRAGIATAFVMGSTTLLDLER